MKFEGSIDINQSLEKVTALFANPEYLAEWQDGFVKKELISGNEGDNGAVSMLYYINGKHKMELQESIISNKLPNTFEAFYHHKHMDNTMKCTFTSLGEKKTRYTTEVHYTRINWVIPKLLAVLFPSMYRKQAQKWMDNFKALAEKN